MRRQDKPGQGVAERGEPGKARRGKDEGRVITVAALSFFVAREHQLLVCREGIMPRTAWTALVNDDPFDPELLAEFVSVDDPYAELDAFLECLRPGRWCWEHLLDEDPF